MLYEEVKTWLSLPGTRYFKDVLKADVEEVKEYLTREEHALGEGMTHAKLRGIVAGLRSTIALLDGELLQETSTIKLTGVENESNE